MSYIRLNKEIKDNIKIISLGYTKPRANCSKCNNKVNKQGLRHKYIYAKPKNKFVVKYKIYWRKYYCPLCQKVISPPVLPGTDFEFKFTKSAIKYIKKQGELYLNTHERRRLAKQFDSNEKTIRLILKRELPKIYNKANKYNLIE